MTVNLHVSFTGICAFVPRDPSGSPTTVVLPNAMQGVYGSPTHKPPCTSSPKLEPHFPELVYQDATGALVSVPLLGKSVDFSLSKPTTSSLTMNPTFSKLVVLMSEVESQLDHIHGDYLSSPPKKEVAARVTLANGALSGSPSVKANGTVIRWNVGNRKNLPLASRVDWNVQADSVTLNILDLDHSGSPQVISFPPARGEVLIKNTCWCPPRTPITDESFLWYYVMCNETPNNCEVPAEVPPGPGSADTYCPPARFSG